MTTQSQPRIISLSAELARPDDDARRQGSQRWQAALHRLCLLRATMNDTTYETEWIRIFEHPSLMANMQQPSKLLAFAALDVLEVQHAHMLMVCGMEGLAFDADAMDEYSELLAAMRMHIDNDLA